LISSGFTNHLRDGNRGGRFLHRKSPAVKPERRR
jgi:hypothetical protein